MKKTTLILTLMLSINMMATERIILLTKETKSRTEVGVEKDPQANYDEDNNTIELSIEGEQMYDMRVIDLYGTVVYTCPVLIVDGTPANYQLPDLPAGIYTLKVESPDVSYEGTLVIE
ncbi:MAG: hypothetical protein ACI31B_07860 [Muribaculaceae bacterium]